MKDFAWFALEFFSVGELCMTLFSPWHRDVSRRSWRGFRPLLALRTLAENVVSRLVGSVVRLAVIFCGFGVFSVVSITGGLFLVAWVVAPMVVAVALGASVAYAETGYAAFALIAIFPLVFSVFGYAKFFREEARERSDIRASKKCLARALRRAEVFVSAEEIENMHTREDVQEVIHAHHASADDFEQALLWETFFERDVENARAFWRRENLRKIRPIARQWKFGFTPRIDRYGYDILLHQNALKELRVCAHPRELEVLKMTLSRPEQHCLLLVAPAGSGKRSLIRFFAKQVADRETRVFSRGERLIVLDIDRILGPRSGGAGGVALLEAIFYEAAIAGNVTLVLENIDRYCGESAVRAGVPDITGVLTEYVAIPDFRLIATTSTQGFHASLERSEGLLQFLEVLELDPIDDAVSIRILFDEFDGVERNRVVFTLPALRRIVRHSLRLHPLVPLPERALDVAKETLSYWKQCPDGDFVTAKTVDAFLSLKTGVPLGEVDISEQEKLARLEQILALRVIGQPEATQQVARSLKRSRAGMHDETRPIGSFLFLGPTGVGKTELAKTLAKTYFGKTGSLVRLDMSEYQNPNAAERLIGTREINVPGQLASLVRDTPYGVLLLDEIEKADARVLDIFLQILDEGFFTDAFGQKTLFSNLIVIATSNAGANVIRKRFAEGADAETVKREVIEYVTEKNIFRPEFLNRFDGVIFFHPLIGADIAAVCRILLDESVATILQNRGVTVTFDDRLIDVVAHLGYDPLFGARSLKRYIADTVETKIAETILRKNPQRGDTIHITPEDIA